MGVVAFVGSIVACGALLSFFDIDTLTSQPDAQDYKLVPYAGDAFGA